MSKQHQNILNDSNAPSTTKSFYKNNISEEYTSKNNMQTIEIIGNKYYTTHAIMCMLREAELYSIKSIKEALSMTGDFEEVTVEYDTQNHNSIIIITVKEKPIVRNVRCHGNTFISNTDALHIMNIYTGMIYDTSSLDKRITQLKAAYQARAIFQGFNIRYFFRNFLRKIDITYNTTESADKNIILDIYVSETFNYKKLFKGIFFGILVAMLLAFVVVVELFAGFYRMRT